MKSSTVRTLLPPWVCSFLLPIWLVSPTGGASLAGESPVSNAGWFREIRFRWTRLLRGRNASSWYSGGVNCLPCLGEIAQLNREGEGSEFRRRSRMIAVHTDGLHEGALQKAMASKGIVVAFPVVTDEDSRITNMFVNGWIPLTVVIDRDRTVRATVLGGGEDAVKRIRDEALSRREEKR